MEYYKLWTVVFGVGLIVMLMVAAKPDKKLNASQENVDEESFAVVELFTSEGCSCCPPADELLDDLVQKARKQDQRIFALAFNVDYLTGLAGRMNTAALVERGIKTGVKRGENSGRILRHENVVRIFNTLDLNSGVGTATLQIPDNVKRSKASIIAYIQDPDSRKLQELNAWTCTNAIVFG